MMGDGEISPCKNPSDDLAFKGIDESLQRFIRVLSRTTWEAPAYTPEDLHEHFRDARARAEARERDTLGDPFSPPQFDEETPEELGTESGAERTPEEFDALLADLKTRGRALRESAAAAPGESSELTEFRADADVTESDSLQDTSRPSSSAVSLYAELFSIFSAGALSVPWDFASAREEWLVPRAPAKWSWTPRADSFDVEFPLIRVNVDLGADANRDTDVFHYARLKWAILAGGEGDVAALESVRRTLAERFEVSQPPASRGSFSRGTVVHRVAAEDLAIVCEGEPAEHLLVLVDFDAGGARPEPAQAPGRGGGARWLPGLRQPPARSGAAAAGGKGRAARAGARERAGLRSPRRRGMRVPPRAAPPVPGAVVVVDGSSVAEHLRPGRDVAACLYVALPQRLTPAKDHLPQVREFWHSTLQTYRGGGAIDRSPM
ncbi:hypothetical protein [Streptomyces melanogenes]|uniref:hypothetical protein n=1 Tax=Streptomyces melanogenes TaxID=67326 RepID=UPI00167DD492|nr:hypothetical protein [Streptomyces melanogenes]GGP78408.1 hypothetical protein GCM10010278_66030 [Streptomyces melanogenes]